jgi:hypothetical protein
LAEVQCLASSLGVVYTLHGLKRAESKAANVLVDPPFNPRVVVTDPNVPLKVGLPITARRLGCDRRGNHVAHKQTRVQGRTEEPKTPAKRRKVSWVTTL